MKIEEAIKWLEEKRRESAKKAMKFAGSETGFKYLIRQGACGLGAEKLKRRLKNGWANNSTKIRCSKCLYNGNDK
jgi:hypothetical protein